MGRSPPKCSIPSNIAKILLSFTELYDKLRGEKQSLMKRMIIDAVTKYRAYSIEKAKREFDYILQYTLRNGLRETIEWYINQGIIKV